ncbi:MAG: F0F1 ATP synthase subunit A [Epsilonproteobacteria bacterium]|nr:F0F1 ATP synthase subunit A [Campylobacterota bacterium]OIO17305.1 MAG: F0F1 ATP synthase subunit A [Helicobacteraceae bacterium CG1_02_36_14]PIP10884.1 MAG: F0F1 ATP synthase subunit A [Sulfurimonas sp. CG23_combo_of_CG06-09_8_20_14_all_36_33]PIS26743.1 MAG: F0F1 ATP synthase subunit A [Sulfurimonas sp. CG08_land_8_20_14_0_20_36_33]PIU35061.1 MAG: F0F1 ATP synthase subunit A [Sulfurimonas sp. CG07_land_8_20_14_0_80_36_56]PIV03306.1 MAG: F0F1 ATP synthase subunit A [Sulfurimonas sp. CG03_la
MPELFTFFGLVGHDKIWIYMTHMLLSVGIAILLVKVAMANLQMVPKGTQNVMEAYIAGVLKMGTDVMGHENARRYLPLVATIGLFVGIANLIGVVPGFEAPTAFLEMPLTLALVVFVYYNFEGIRRQGVIKYFKHFLGPVWWLYWLMFPIEIVSHFSRLVSLSFRLFGNVKGDDMFLMVILMLAPWLLPMIPFALLTFMAFLQAFIFMMLTYVYLGGAVAVDEH